MRALFTLLAYAACAFDVWHLQHAIDGMDAAGAIDHPDYKPMLRRLNARKRQLHGERAFR